MKLARRAHRVRVPGFRFAGVRAGLKARGPDVALIALDAPGVAAGVLTTNQAPAAPVVVTRERLRAGAVSAVLVHAGNANACTGRQGRRTVEESTSLAAALLGVPAGRVLACATGRIGVQVPLDPLLRGVRAAHAALAADGFPGGGAGHHDDRRLSEDRRAAHPPRPACGHDRGARQGRRHDRAGPGHPARLRVHRRADRSPRRTARAGGRGRRHVQRGQRRRRHEHQRHDPPARQRRRGESRPSRSGRPATARSSAP